MQWDSTNRSEPKSSFSGSETGLRLLIDTGLLLACEREVNSVAQHAIDAGLRICGATFGAFFCVDFNDSTDGSCLQLFKSSAADPAALAPLTPQTYVPFDDDLLNSLKSEGVQRFGDISNFTKFTKLREN